METLTIGEKSPETCSPTKDTHLGPGILGAMSEDKFLNLLPVRVLSPSAEADLPDRIKQGKEIKGLCLSL